MTESASLTLTFGSDRGEDDYYLIEVEPNPVTSGEFTQIKVYMADSELLAQSRIYEGTRTLGVGSSISSTTQQKTEKVYFSNSNSASTDYPVIKVNNALALTEIVVVDRYTVEQHTPKGSWLVLSPNDDNSVKADDDISGSVEINYDAKIAYKTYKWLAPNVDESVDFPFFLIRPDRSPVEFSITVENIVVYDPTQVKLIIKDVSNESVIENAQITITKQDDDSFIPLQGISDENGECIFTLIPNEEYGLKVIAEGYIDSDIDYLKNDSFKVPIPTSAE